LFDYMDRHAGFNQQFSEAMDSVEALAGDGFATDLDWGRFERIIDVGGSRGSKSLAILKRHARPSALVVDRPQVIAEARQYWANHHADGHRAPSLPGRRCFRRYSTGNRADGHLSSLGRPAWF